MGGTPGIQFLRSREGKGKESIQLLKDLRLPSKRNLRREAEEMEEHLIAEAVGEGIRGGGSKKEQEPVALKVFKNKISPLPSSSSTAIPSP